MALVNCNCKCNCTIAAIIASAIIGVIAAFLQITGVLAIAPVFLWVLFGIAIVYLGVLIIASALEPNAERCDCFCSILNALLIGILGTILLAVILLLIDVAATSVIGAILVGLLVFFFALTLTSTAGLIRCRLNCEG